jgi:hypothetical protein
MAKILKILKTLMENTAMFLPIVAREATGI